MQETRGFDIQLGGQTRRAWLNWRACQRIGMRGPADADGFAAIAAKCATDFTEAANLVHAALVDRTPTVEEVLEWIMDEWDHTNLADFINRLWGVKSETTAISDTRSTPRPTTAQASDGMTSGQQWPPLDAG